MNSSKPAAYYVAPFHVVDAETNKPTQANRSRSLETAFERLDRYLARQPTRDAHVIDVNGAPVPRPHRPLPTPILDGRTVWERRRKFLYEHYDQLAWYLAS